MNNKTLPIWASILIVFVVAVDFSNELEAYGGGSANASLISWQIVKTLTQFPEIDQVVISVEGRTEDILQP